MGKYKLCYLHTIHRNHWQFHMSLTTLLLLSLLLAGFHIKGRVAVACRLSFVGQEALSKLHGALCGKHDVIMKSATSGSTSISYKQTFSLIKLDDYCQLGLASIT